MLTSAEACLCLGFVAGFLVCSVLVVTWALCHINPPDDEGDGT